MAEPTPLRERRCPTCGQTFKAEGVPASKCLPFCSERCRNVDLGNWLDERYVISKPELDEAGEGDDEL